MGDETLILFLLSASPSTWSPLDSTSSMTDTTYLSTVQYNAGIQMSTTGNTYWNISHNVRIIKYYKVKLEEWGLNPWPSDYEADTLTAWLKIGAASQAASSLPILIRILHYYIAE